MLEYQDRDVARRARTLFRLILSSRRMLLASLVWKPYHKPNYIYIYIYIYRYVFLFVLMYVYHKLTELEH